MSTMLPNEPAVNSIPGPTIDADNSAMAAALGSTAPASNPVAPLSDEAVTMLANFKAIDPTRAGVGLDMIRPFYRRLGWGKVLPYVRELEQAGRLSKRTVLNSKGGVGFHVYTWKEV